MRSPCQAHLDEVLLIDAGVDVPHKHGLGRQRGHSGDEGGYGAAGRPAALVFPGRRQNLRGPMAEHAHTSWMDAQRLQARHEAA